jgi:uncharacterized RDD family membrane protein YckC
MEKKNVKAKFIYRLIAFIIDMMIVYFVTTLISYPFIASKTENLEKISSQTSEIVEQFGAGEITMNSYISETAGLSFESAKIQGITILISIFVSIIYFVIVQYNNKGQTFGKKLMKIRINSLDGNLSMNQLVVRSLLINSILLNMVQVAAISFINDSMVYFYVDLFFESIQYLFVFISIILIMFSKERKGLHDLIAKTEVIYS